MAAIFYNYRENAGTIFKGNINVVPNVSIPFLNNMIGQDGGLVINEVIWQHRDTIQYFLTFDDLINYFYFGKGLGTVNVSGTAFHDCNSGWTNLDELRIRIGSIRGEVSRLIFASVVFEGVLSSFTLRASADPNNINTVDFSLQFDVIGSSLPTAVIQGAC